MAGWGFDEVSYFPTDGNYVIVSGIMMELVFCLLSETHLHSDVANEHQATNNEHQATNHNPIELPKGCQAI